MFVFFLWQVRGRKGNTVERTQRQPLAGIRVLDFGRYVAGPFAATLLGYLGAEVIRIEKPGGSEDRFIQPLGPGEEGSLIHHTGCNKRSLTLALGTPQARAITDRLVAGADVVVANLPAPALEKLGLAYDQLKAIRPDIILVSQNSFGQHGPDADKPGFDGIGQAMSGAMFFTGLPRAPVKAAAPYVDYSTAVMAAFGAMAALMHRQQTGEGQHVEGALLHTALSVFGAFVTEEATAAPGRSPTGNRVQTSGPSDCFACADGHILVHVVGPGLFKRVARLLGRPDWLTDPALQSDEDRGRAGEQIGAVMAHWCAARTRDEALAALQGAGIPAGPVLSIAEAVRQSQVQANNWLVPVDRAGGLAPAQVVDMPLRFSAIDAGIKCPPPAIGADTDAILAELGYSADDIRQLRTDGIV